MEILIFSSILSVLYYTEYIITQPLFIWPSLFELSLCVFLFITITFYLPFCVSGYLLKNQRDSTGMFLGCTLLKIQLASASCLFLWHCNFWIESLLELSFPSPENLRDSGLQQFEV